jgi:uncharacterized protein (DUF433 family)
MTTDEAGVPRIVGTPLKVVGIALDRLAHAWTADEICRQHPGLTLPQVQAALGCYFENQAECDRQIEESLKVADEIFARHSNPQ